MSFAPNRHPEPPTSNGTHALAGAADGGSVHPSGLSARTVHLDLASWLVARELGAEADAEGLFAAAEQVGQKLSHGLSRSISAAGSQALVSRALHLEQTEFPFLEGVRAGIPPGACFEGLIESTRDVESGEAARGLLTVLRRMLDVLANYMGEELTLRMVREVWPDLPLLALSEPLNSDGQEATP
ncbi:MAG: hypothetical protein M3069_28305 [Chloroflexota bacterium]|nr:hypothetical protein [Chloroflexota bacterium]